jgi:hypothetical protein
MTKKTATVLTTTDIWGLNAKTDGLTDRQSQSDSDYDFRRSNWKMKIEWNYRHKKEIKKRKTKGRRQKSNKQTKKSSPCCSRVRFPAGAENFSLHHGVQPPIQCVPGTLSLGVKRQGREADHSPPSKSEVKNAWSCTSTTLYVFMA